MLIRFSGFVVHAACCWLTNFLLQKLQVSKLISNGTVNIAQFDKHLNDSELRFFKSTGVWRFIASRNELFALSA